MDSAFWAVALLALATVLIVAEIFIPSAGMLAIGMLCSLIGAFYFAWSAWWPDQTNLFLGFVAFALVLLPGAAIGALLILPRTRFGKRIFLEAPDEQSVLPFAQEGLKLSALIGKQGKAVTPLMPGGLISVGRERLHAFTEGMFIESGAAVEIVKISGTRVVVREISAEQQEQVTAEPEAESASAADSSDPVADELLDFDIPERP